MTKRIDNRDYPYNETLAIINSYSRYKESDGRSDDGSFLGVPIFLISILLGAGADVYLNLNRPFFAAAGAIIGICGTNYFIPSSFDIEKDSKYEGHTYSGIELVNYLNDLSSLADNYHFKKKMGSYLPTFDINILGVPLGSLNNYKSDRKKIYTKLLNHEYDKAKCSTLEDEGLFISPGAVLNVHNEDLPVYKTAEETFIINETLPLVQEMTADGASA